MRRGLFPDRAEARAAVAGGKVLVSGAPTDNPDCLVDVGDAITLTSVRSRFVGRGGEKLEAALAAWPVAVRDRRAIDVGASTGGFTDCLLQRGAAEVVAVDVGRGQLHERLRADPRVTVRERTNVRHVDAGDLGGEADIVVADLSFISLRAVADQLVGLVRPSGDLIVLVKPQFEAKRAEASRGRGVISDPAVWGRVLAEVSSSLAAVGTVMMGAMASPIHGADGNTEFLVHLRRSPAETVAPVDLDAVVRAAQDLL